MLLFFSRVLGTIVTGYQPPRPRPEIHLNFLGKKKQAIEKTYFALISLQEHSHTASFSLQAMHSDGPFSLQTSVRCDWAASNNALLSFDVSGSSGPLSVITRPGMTLRPFRGSLQIRGSLPPAPSCERTAHRLSRLPTECSLLHSGC